MRLVRARVTAIRFLFRYLGSKVGRCRGAMSWCPAERTILGEIGETGVRRLERMWRAKVSMEFGMVVIRILVCVLDGRLKVPSRKMWISCDAIWSPTTNRT